jgi:hypothetical protein
VERHFKAAKSAFVPTSLYAVDPKGEAYAPGMAAWQAWRPLHEKTKWPLRLTTCATELITLGAKRIAPKEFPILMEALEELATRKLT